MPTLLPVKRCTAKYLPEEPARCTTTANLKSSYHTPIPYLAKLTMDPADWHDFEQRFWDRPEVKVRHLDASEPDQWTVFVACASEMVRELLEQNW